VRRLLVIFLVLSLLGIAIAVGGIVLARKGAGVSAFDGEKVLTLVLDSRLEDHAAMVPFQLPGEEPEPTLALVWRGLDAARRDPAVRGVALRIVDADFGLAKAAELRRQLEATAAAGKFVACYLDTAGEGSNGTLEYYVASACQHLSLAPAGELNLLGLWSDAVFLRGSLEKLRVEPDFLTSGRFKSAGEPFTERAHSPAAREAIDAVLDDYFAGIVGGIAASRELDAGEVRALVERAPLPADDALASRLVDALEFPDQFEARLEELAGGEIEQVDLAAWSRRHLRAGSGPRIAVLFARGTIVRGGNGFDPWSGETFIGSDGLGDQLRRLAEDDGVAAVVVRIDSPGGSALASDLILRRMELLAARKPVIVSMSDVAASGGYYIAARATRIVAEPGTLTGSIGVVTGKLATGRFQEELLGATHDVLARGGRAGLYSTLRPWSEEERAVLERRVDDIYRRFVGHVAAGRELAPERVHEIAQGRIWTGEDALALGLVDELGGLDAAVAAARAEAGLDAGAGTIELHPKPRTFFDWLAATKGSPFAADAARLARLLAETRAPAALELPRALAELARPFD
jgi:protease-4